MQLSANNIVVGQYSKREPQNIASVEKIKKKTNVYENSYYQHQKAFI